MLIGSAIYSYNVFDFCSIILYHILLLSLDFLHQSPQISQDEIEHAVLDAIDASEEVPYGILAQNAAF